MPGLASSAILWAAWKDSVLSVAYRGGATYDYLDVPARVYAAMMASPSKGEFVNRDVKPFYRFRKRAA